MTNNCSLTKILVQQEDLKDLTSETQLFVKELSKELPINSFILLTDLQENDYHLCQVVSEQTIKKVFTPPNFSLFGIASRDARQAALINSLTNDEIRIVVCRGAAGTGKTTVALAYALQELFDNDKVMYLSKPTELVGRGRTFGPVPGDIDEKYAPHIASYESILKKLTGSEGRYISLLKDKNKIQFVPVEYTRGNNYEDSVFILDEAQNLDWHELKTVVSRIAESTKLIILGDPEQIDARFSYKQSGLYAMLNSNAFKQCSFSSEIELTKQYRGRIPQLIHDIDMEIRKNEE